MKKTSAHFRPLVLAAALSLFVATPLWAQDDEMDDILDEDEGEEESDDEEAEEASSDDEKPPMAVEPELGDGDSQTIYVIQGKPRLVGGSFEISPQFVQSINNRFTIHTGLIVSGIYHLRENVALELNLGSFLWVDGDNAPRLGGRDTDLTTEIKQKERLAPELVSLYRLTWLTTADFQWSPIYGKVSIQDFALGQFNVYLSVGAGLTGLQLENQSNPGEFHELPGPLGEGLGPMSLTTTFGGGLRFYFGDWFGVRMEVRDYVNALSVIREDVPSVSFSTFDVTNTVLLQIGASFIF